MQMAPSLLSLLTSLASLANFVQNCKQYSEIDAMAYPRRILLL